MTVNALRKTSKDDEVISLSKTLIKNWKKFIPAQGNGSNNTSTSSTTNSTSSTSKPKKEKDEKISRDDRDKSISERKLPTQFPPVSNTTDAVRLKCREMLAAAIATDAKAEDFDGTPQNPISL